MLRQLVDPASALTARGLVLSAVGTDCAIADLPKLALVIVRLTLLIDHVGGGVGQRTQRRPAEAGQIGKNLDPLADLVIVFPAVKSMIISHASATSVAAITIRVVARALRKSSFNVFGSRGSRFIGVPTSYAVLLAAIIFLLRPVIPKAIFPNPFAFVLILFGVLRIAPLRLPKASIVLAKGVA